MPHEELDGIKTKLQAKRGDGSKVAFKPLFEAKTAKELEEFHNKCDGMGPTLTVLYGCQNVLFGGYTSRDWASTESKTMYDDPEAFLFFKTHGSNARWQIFPHKSFYGAITCHKNFGPTFGGGFFYWQDYDLQTFVINSPNHTKERNGVLMLNGTLNFNCAYKSPDKKFKNETVNGGTMNIRRIAVYQVSEYFWRQKPEEAEIERQKNYLCNFETQKKHKLPFYNILLLGLINAGKSSLYNTIATAISGKRKKSAPTGKGQGSVTNMLFGYKVYTSSDEDIHIKIFDVRGIHPKRDLSPELEHILEGALPERFEFLEEPREVRPEMLITETSIEYKIHIVALVCDIKNWPVLDKIGQDEDENVLAAVRSTVSLIRRKGVPLVVVATKCDEADSDVQNDVNSIYLSKTIFDALNLLSQSTGVTMDNIFPVVNYVDDMSTEVSEAQNSLAIQALYSMIKTVEDYLEQNPDVIFARNTWKSRFGTLRNGCDARYELDIPNLGGRTFRVLCLGSVGSGKSSFIDSLVSTLSGTVMHGAAGEILCIETGETSHTKKFQMYPLKTKLNNQEHDMPVLLGDMPGLQTKGGVKVADVKMVVEGHVPNMFEIQGGLEIGNENFIRRPSVTDKVHCVCFVFDITTVDNLPDSIQRSTRELVQWVASQEIPFIVVLTKIDALSEAVYRRTMDVFRDLRVREKKDKLQEMFGFREAKIFPVRNYIQERDVEQDTNRLLLDALQEVLRLGSMHLSAEQPDEPNRVSDPADGYVPAVNNRI